LLIFGQQLVPKRERRGKLKNTQYSKLEAGHGTRGSTLIKRSCREGLQSVEQQQFWSRAVLHLSNAASEQEPALRTGPPNGPVTASITKNQKETE